MRVLVCGPRDWTDQWAVDAGIANATNVLTEGPFAALIEGGASGVDAMAAAWARKWAIPILTFKADWRAHGKAAGPIRNQQMIDEGKPDMVLAFRRGKEWSRGTGDMVRRAQAARVLVLIVEVDAEPQPPVAKPTAAVQPQATAEEERELR